MQLINKGCQYACHPLPGRGSECPYVYLTVPDDRQGCQISISKWFENRKVWSTGTQALKYLTASGNNSE
jgi:hypothetical protein